MPCITYADAVESYLAGYSSPATVAAYRCDLALWQRHCDHHNLGPLGDVVRADLERNARALEHDGRAPATVARRLATLVGFYRWCADEQLIAHCPALNPRRPRRPSESPRLGLSRTELADWLDAGEQIGGHPYALACLLALNGLRVGEVCAADVVDLAQDRWHHTLAILGKGDKLAVVLCLRARWMRCGPRSVTARQGRCC